MQGCNFVRGERAVPRCVFVQFVVVVDICIGHFVYRPTCFALYSVFSRGIVNGRIASVEIYHSAGGRIVEGTFDQRATFWLVRVSLYRLLL